MPTDYFGETVAPHYDDDCVDMFDPAVVDPAVDVLAELAGGGAAVEFGVGTGRLALPLSERGVRVHGIDLSGAMIAEMRAKPGAETIETTVGDFATTRVDGAFRLVYLVFNTINNLTTQDAQVACFANAAAHLEPGGCFVIEVSVPDLQRLPYGETFRPFTVTRNHLGVDEYDVVNQGLISHHYRIDNGPARVESVPFRYVWPAELDLMAQLAGMRLQQRWADWYRERFTSTSTSPRVSVGEDLTPVGMLVQCAHERIATTGAVGCASLCNAHYGASRGLRRATFASWRKRSAAWPRRCAYRCALQSLASSMG